MGTKKFGYEQICVRKKFEYEQMGTKKFGYVQICVRKNNGYEHNMGRKKNYFGYENKLEYEKIKETKKIRVRKLFGYEKNVYK